jgi:hypothetical protein
VVCPPVLQIKARADGRCRMALYLQVHPARFHAAVLYIHYYARTGQIP